MSKKEKQPRSSFDLGVISFNDYLSKQFTKYSVYLPDSSGKYDKCYTDTNFIKVLDYAYGVGKFRITSEAGFCFEFNPDDYSKKDIKRCGYLEAFDFVTHNLLTNYELDIWKQYVRNEDMF